MINAIVLIFDDLYFLYAKACINSIKSNYSNHPIIAVYYEGNDDEIVKYLSSIENLEFNFWDRDCFETIGLDQNRVDLGIVDNLKVYYKYFIWTKKFDNYDNVLYLDADTLVLGSLDELFDQEDFFVVTDYNESDTYKLFRPEFSDDVTLRSVLDQDGLFYPGGAHDMINAGVLLIPRKFRTEPNLLQLIGITYRYSKYMMFADQSAISIWCHKNRIQIRQNYYYNFQISFYTKIFSNFFHEKIRIVHFSWCKPETYNFQFLRKSFEHFFLVDGCISRFQL